jgi:hypothetical protein
MRTGYQILVGEPEGKRSLKRPRQKWKDNIKIVLKERGYMGVHLAENRVQWFAFVNVIINFLVP